MLHPRTALRRIASLGITIAYSVLAIAGSQLAFVPPARAATFTCTGGIDGVGTITSSTTDTYYIPPVGTLSAGNTTFSLGTVDNTDGGSSTPVGAGDELLVVQMQAGSFGHVNNSSYGAPWSPGNAGAYEYVGVTALNGTTVTIQGGGSGGGLINSYTEAAATSTSGQQTYQIIRVPQYLSATVGALAHAKFWDGQAGGVLAVDVTQTLNLSSGTIYSDSTGFRGGGLSYTTTSPSTALNNDYANTVTMNGTPTGPGTNNPADGVKGEGIFGAPAMSIRFQTFILGGNEAPLVTYGLTDGYPGGDMGRGAPGDGGGGGTNDNPAKNDQDSGGGGGGNVGAGGHGGYPWTPWYSGSTPLYGLNSPGQHDIESTPSPAPSPADGNHNPNIGGIGGGSLGASYLRAYMGGGGGGGASTDGGDGPNNHYSNFGSSGGMGAGIIMLRTGGVSGSGTISAEGTDGDVFEPAGDGGGGGGAGGTVIVTSPNSLSGLTIHADGGAGSNAFWNQNNASNPANAYGPGGGGGGGAVWTSGAATVTVNGGANGETNYGLGESYGATSGSSGSSSSMTSSQIPGKPSGAECFNNGAGGTPTIYNGPIDPNEGTYFGANETGTYDGSVAVNNNDDFTAVGMPLTNTSGNTGNLGTTIGPPFTGGSFSYTSVPAIEVPHSFYYSNSAGVTSALSFTATAPATPSGWKVQVCPDNGSNAPNCSLVTTVSCTSSNAGTWVSVTAASTTNTGRYCYYRPSAVSTYVKYWTVSTPPTGPFTAFSRSDGSTVASDPYGASNTTHDELYAGYISLVKNVKVISTNCPAGMTPTYSSGVCPGGILQYTIAYESYVYGANQGTEATNASAFPETSPGSLVITDDGTITASSSTTQSNWATFSDGVTEALGNGLSSNTTCGSTPHTCGDTIAGTTYTYYTGVPASSSGSSTFASGVTKFSAQVGGPNFSLYPANFPSQYGAGSITFAIVVQ